MRRGNKFLVILIFISLFIIIPSAVVEASIPKLKLPYPKGEKRIISQGYNCDGWNSPYCTHKGKDKYAIDFNLPGEQDYGKLILASSEGVAYQRQQKNKKGVYSGYGKYIDIVHKDGHITRYAHLKSFIVKNGKEVNQGEKIGYSDNTGASTGTHLHFALYKKQGSQYIGVKPEPMSGYTNFRAGKWYLSDNKIVSGEVKGAKTKKEVWNQKFVSYKLTRINSKVYKDILNFKNTGNTTWVKNKVSLNVIGGYGGVAAKFYHPSWLTKLRPTSLFKNTAPSKSGAFIFYIQLPKTPGKYYPQFRPVHSLSGGGFEWIGKDVGTFPIEIKPIPKPTCSISANPTSILKGKFSLLKWSSSNATSVSITNLGNVALSGSKKVYPSSTTTYKMTAKGKGGTTTCSVKVKVNVPPPPPPPSPIPPPPPPPPPPSPSSEDITPPQVSFIELDLIQNTSPFEIRWQAQDASAIKSTEIQYKEGKDEDWKIIGNEIHEEDNIYSVMFGDTNRKIEEGKVYTFRVRATDEFGNQSEWIESPKILVDITIWYVDNDGDADFTEIQDAIENDNVSSGDTIIVRDGVYRKFINVNKPLIIPSENGAEKTFIEATNFSDCIIKIVSNDVAISNFTIQSKEEHSGPGLCLNSVNYINISGNYISTYGTSIDLYNSNKNKLTKNNLISLHSVSLSLNLSSGNEIYLNNFYNGVYFNRMLPSPFGDFDPDAPQLTLPLEEIPPGVIPIQVAPMKFEPNSFTVKNGEVVSLALTSLKGSHSLIFENSILEKVRIYVSGGQTRGIAFLSPEPGAYRFYCDVPGHKEGGERGVMYVTENDNPHDLINIWNSSNLGNYWDNYKTRYPDAKEVGNIGIWDTPYTISSNNVDNYPLVKPFENYTP